MLTIHEIGKKYGIKMPKLRRMARDGILNFEPASGAYSIVTYFQKTRSLTAAHMLQLIETPGLLAEFTDAAQARVRRELANLGNVTPAPADVAANLAGAAAGDPDCVQSVVEWAKSVIPPIGEVPHHFLAVRLLMAVPANLRQYEEKRLPRVLLQCRRSDEFAGWWRLAPVRSRQVTLYSRPKKKKKEYDL